MFRLFQVNTGVYLQLDDDVSPTALVRDLCAAVESISGESVDSQVLLTADGQQMDPNEVIGSYSIGTDSKPIFLFYKSYSDSPSPPQVPSRLKPSPDLQRQMELLHLKPSPALFQHQATLAKLLGEYASDLGAAAMQLASEYGLQMAGWDTVLNNCSNIIRTYQKHHLLFCKAVGAFQSSRQHYLDLLNKFPRQVRILQDLPLPPGHTASTTQSLYDWISTHDEKNSLDDLSNECQKALAQVESEPIQKAISTSENILATAELSPSHTQQFKQCHARLQELASVAKELTGIQKGLAENIQSTSQRALRSGDGGTIADLVVSHHSSLQLMTQQNAQLEAIVKEVEGAKTELRGHLHSQLHSVTNLQMKLAESNSQLVLLYEHVKLARKRFDVLEQVCSAPDVLARVVVEVEQRRAFRSALQQKAEVLSYTLGRACEEERERRREFLASCRQHFITTLFPDLHAKAPELTVQLSKGTSEEGMDLSGIKQLLPTAFNVAPLPSVLSFGNQQAKYSQTDYQCLEAAVSKCVVGATTQTDHEYIDASTQANNGYEYIQASTQTDHEYIQAATQTDHEYIQAATQTDHEYIEGSAQTYNEYAETAAQTDSEYLESSRTLHERVRELEQQLEVARSEGARLSELLATESEGSKQEAKRCEQLVDTLKKQVNQQQLLLEQQCADHRAEQSRLQEQAEELERSKVRHQQAQAVVGGLRDQLELAEGRVHSLEKEKEGLTSTLERQECDWREKVEELEHQLQLERDSHMKLCMELEREVKELRRAVEVESPIAPQKPVPSKAMSTVDRIAVSNLREGDTALFMTDAHGNYLALSIDGRTYYLNHSCIASFGQDLNSKVQHLNFRRKLLLGRITERMFVEVRKEGNRLHVPVGSRLYKVHAEEVIVP